MKCGQQKGFTANADYFEVFDSDKQLRFGITSADDKSKIEEIYPGEYHFEEYDLNEDSKLLFSLTFDQILLIIVALLAVCVIAGLIWPERYSFLQLYINTTG